MASKQCKPPEQCIVKRPPNAFLLFLRQERPKLAEQFPRANCGEMARILGSNWKALSIAEKRPFVEEAERLRTDFAQKHPNWKFHRRTKCEKKNKKNAKSEVTDSSTTIAPPLDLMPTETAIPVITTLQQPSLNMYPSSSQQFPCNLYYSTNLGQLQNASYSSTSLDRSGFPHYNTSLSPLHLNCTSNLHDSAGGSSEPSTSSDVSWNNEPNIGNEINGNGQQQVFLMDNQGNFFDQQQVLMPQPFGGFVPTCPQPGSLACYNQYWNYSTNNEPQFFPQFYQQQQATFFQGESYPSTSSCRFSPPTDSTTGLL